MKVNQFKPWVGEEEYKEIEGCFTENWITEGPKSKEFVKQLLDLTGAKYGVLAPNGTLAIYLALRAIDLKPGDQVLVPDFTFLGSASAVEMAGGVPVFIDVNKENFQLDLDSAEKFINPKTKAIMPVHIYGTMAKMDEVMEFAKKHN
ncbi:aminotransferase class I/II-fold pyridoxal phosphate-dependent enzyme, partial [bacterium]|nr:aminotransferase class I/II-fold pyridoxal phosphate-dependent enzyme [bacterium]